MESMFSGCKSIEFLNLSEFKTVSVNNMSCIFEGCISLKNIILSNWDTSNVVDMNSMFAGCSALEDINISYRFKYSSESTKLIYARSLNIERTVIFNFDPFYFIDGFMRHKYYSSGIILMEVFPVCKCHDNSVKN